jgi:hypothetical protein
MADAIEAGIKVTPSYGKSETAEQLRRRGAAMRRTGYL